MSFDLDDPQFRGRVRFGCLVSAAFTLFGLGLATAGALHLTEFFL